MTTLFEVFVFWARFVMLGWCIQKRDSGFAIKRSTIFLTAGILTYDVGFRHMVVCAFERIKSTLYDLLLAFWEAPI